MIASKPQQLREMLGTDLPSHSSEGPSPADTLILNLWLSELRWYISGFLAAQSVLLCYSSPRELISTKDLHR